MSIEGSKYWNEMALESVWIGTEEALKRSCYRDFNDKSVVLPERKPTWEAGTRNSSQATYLYDFVEQDRMEPRYEDSEIAVIDQDCLDVAKSEIDSGRRPAVLHFAYATGPINRANIGSIDQGADLCRRSELSLALGYAEYPITDKLIYTSDVTVFRASHFDFYKFLPQPFKVAVISSCSTDVLNSYLQESIEKVSKLAYTQLYAAYQQGHDSVILGAFSCEKSGHPPEAVAKIYKDFLENEFKGAFKRVVFAISDDEHHMPKGTFSVFKNFFNKK